MSFLIKSNNCDYEPSLITIRCFIITDMKRNRYLSQTTTPGKKRKYMTKESDTSTDRSDSSSSVVSSEMDEPYTYLDFQEGIDRRLTSSPVRFIEADVSYDSQSSDSDLSESLYPGSSKSVHQFLLEFKTLMSSQQLSDVTSEAILTLFTDTLPLPNKCPSLRSIKQNLNVQKHLIEVHRDKGTFYFLDLEYQLRLIIANNPEIFSDINDNPSDIRNSTCFNFIDSSERKYIYLIMNVDGMSSIFQSRQYKIWPVMAMVVNLRPEERRRFRNILFCCMYYGIQKPDMTFLMQSFVDQIAQFSMTYNEFVVEIKIITLSADLPAKAAALNMNQFNGYFGCNICLIKGTYSNEYRKMIFLDRDCELRDTVDYLRHVNNAKNTGNVCYGVKGPTPLSKIMNTPIVPLDPMHLLFLGVVRSLILHVLRQKLVNESDLSDGLTSISVPSSFKRKPRSMIFKMKFKATEWKYFILYYYGLLLQSQNDSIKRLGILLSTFIYTLMKKTISRRDCEDAGKLINDFRDLCITLFGESVLSYSLHALEHLPYLVKKFGALWNVSVAPFESSFYKLKRTLTGTRNEGKLIVERFLINKIVCDIRLPSNAIAVGETEILGSTTEIGVIEDFDTYDFTFDATDRQAFRFRKKNTIFHSFDYPYKQRSASYFAVLSNENLVRIDHIIFRQLDGCIYCLCTLLQKRCKISDLVSFPSSFSSTISQHCQTYSVTFSSKLVVESHDFVSHVIVYEVKHNSTTINLATPVLQNFDQE